MKLQVPFIQLPLLFDAEALAREIEALGESVWKPHPQGFAGNSMLPLLAVNGDPDNEAFSGQMRPTPHLQRCPYMRQTLASFGATIGRTRLMRLAGQAEVARHADQGYYWAERVRVHVPLVTQPTVQFECDGDAINMAAGECWIFDTWRQHRVLNDAVQSRIHLVCDTVGGGAFWDMVTHGRAHDAPRDGWTPKRVVPDPSALREFACEAVNVPAVMSPWELGQHLSFLITESLPHPQLESLQQRSGHLVREWKGLWAQYGDAVEGRATFRAAFDAFAMSVRGPSQGVTLRNEMPWFQVMMVMISRVAVAPADARVAGRAAGEYA
ncbi:MAG: aspartyl/asparaginyl beta-hydroxylase domain-containing protein [Lysobacteraceae bacterium]